MSAPLFVSLMLCGGDSGCDTQSPELIVVNLAMVEEMRPDKLADHSWTALWFTSSTREDGEPTYVHETIDEILSMWEFRTGLCHPGECIAGRSAR